MLMSLPLATILFSSLGLAARTFPPDFKFGVATAAYQIEGAWNVDGKGENIWDHICHTNPSFILNEDNGDIACDSYYKWRDDIANIKALGVDFYRFSLSWSRIMPDGRPDIINQVGVNYYRNLIQGLLDEGIEPIVTLFHWDLPQPLEESGGFLWEHIEVEFRDFARVAFENFGDLVKNWITFNEPMIICHQGYGEGTKAPGLVSRGLNEYICSHNLIKAHARAWHLYDDEFRPVQKGKISITINTEWFEPANIDDPLDQEAAERAQQFHFGWHANPIFNQNYPEIMIDRIGNRSALEGYEESRLPKFTDEQLDYISGTFDFLGLNFYSASLAQWREDVPIGDVSFYNDISVNTFKNDSWGDSGSSWLKVTPWAFRKLLNWLKVTYNNPEIFVTENGVSDLGGLDDQDRIDFFLAYLDSLLDAVLEDDVNVSGYTAWSLMDNFEWTRGYSERFGLYNINFSDPERTRTPKKSAEWYKQLALTHCLTDCN